MDQPSQIGASDAIVRRAIYRHGEIFGRPDGAAGERGCKGILIVLALLKAR